MKNNALPHYTLVLLMALGLAPGFQSAAALDPATNGRAVALALGGEDVLDRVRAAESVRVQRVDSLPPGESPGDPSKLLELTPEIVLPGEEATRLKKILEDHSTYHAPPKRCKFRANVRYVFGEDAKAPSVVLCFGCGELQVWRQSELLAFSPFDKAYGALLDQAQRLFPDDDLIASFDPAIFEERARSMRDGN